MCPFEEGVRTLERSLTGGLQKEAGGSKTLLCKLVRTPRISRKGHRLLESTAASMLCLVSPGPMAGVSERPPARSPDGLSLLITCVSRRGLCRPHLVQFSVGCWPCISCCPRTGLHRPPRLPKAARHSCNNTAPSLPPGSAGLFTAPQGLTPMSSLEPFPPALGSQQLRHHVGDREVEAQPPAGCTLHPPGPTPGLLTHHLDILLTFFLQEGDWNT